MKNLQFLHPKFIPTWILFFFMRIGAFIPFKAQYQLAKLMAIVFKPLVFKKLNIARINILKCFPNLDKKQQKTLLKQHCVALMMSVFEMANCFYMSDQRLQQSYNFNHKDILQNLINKNGNIIIITSHFMMLFLMIRIISSHFQIYCVYRPQNNKLFNHALVTHSAKNGVNIIKAKDSRNIIKILKNGKPLLQVTDQDIKKTSNVFAPFFSIQTNTITATSKLAKSANADVVYFNFFRNAVGYQLDFTIIDNYPTNDDILDATTINQYVEKQIKKAPEQYLWIHRRFKTRPDGEKSFYT